MMQIHMEPLAGLSEELAGLFFLLRVPPYVCTQGKTVCVQHRGMAQFSETEYFVM